MATKTAFTYTRPFRKADIVFDWKTDRERPPFKPVLVDDEMELYNILKANMDKNIIAIDTETTSLDIGHAELVGMSFSFSPKEGYYIPVKHTNSKNCDMKKLGKIWKNYLKDQTILFYNLPFDIPILEKLGLDFRDLKTFDVQNLVYLKDTNIHLPSLKEAEEFFLGWIMPTYEDTTQGRNFSELTSEEAYFYAGADTAGLFAVFEKLRPDVAKECAKILQLDNRVVKALMYMSREDFHIRKEILPEIIDYYAKAKRKHELAFFDFLGYPINIRSTKQLAEALIKMGIHTGVKTKGNAMSVGAEALAKVQNSYPIVKEIVNYNSLASIESGLKKYLDYPSVIHCKYQTCNTPHGRLSSGGDKDLKLPKGVQPYYAKVNAQNFPTSQERLYRVVEANSDWNIEGYNFVPIETDESLEGKQYVESADYESAVRRIIHSPDPEWYVLNADYKGAELRLAGNFSKEPNLIIPFSQGLDLHRYTAEQMYGVENYTKELRGKGKIMNFLALYQGGEDAILANMNYTISWEEANALLTTYWNTMSSLATWIRIQINKAKANPTVKTYYGRPRRLHFYLRHEFFSMRAFGERSVPSQIIAGTLGDIIRMKLVDCYVKLFSHPEFKYDVKFIMTVHDSIEFLIRKKRIQEVMNEIDKIMVHQESDWALPLTMEYELGFSHGFAIPFEKNAETGIWELKFKQG